MVEEHVVHGNETEEWVNMHINKSRRKVEKSIRYIDFESSEMKEMLRESHELML